ncbi:MAG: hypothetical protein ACFB00_06630 [Parvularculaceae bacterium]
MLFHYVEDNSVDAHLLKRLTDPMDGLAMTTSRSVDDWAESIGEKRGDGASRPELDGVLIDIYRPDAISIENDIDLVRRICGAPIAFVTGGEIGDLRRRAIDAGAEGVFVKSSLSPAALKDMFQNASERRLRMARAAAAERLRDALTYSSGVLRDTVDVAVARRVNVPIPAAFQASDVADCVLRSLAAYADGDDFTAVTDMLLLLEQRIDRTLRERGVELSIGGPWRAASEIGDDDMTRLGAAHFVLGLCESLSRNEGLVVEASDDDAGPSGPIAVFRADAPSPFVNAPLGAREPQRRDSFGGDVYDAERNIRIAATCFAEAGVHVNADLTGLGATYVLRRAAQP